MRSLFLKIFLWFWGAMVLIGLALFLVVTTTQPDPLPEPWRESSSAVLAAYAAAATRAWEEGGSPALAVYLSWQEVKSRTRLYLFDDKGRELSGRRPSPFGRPPDGSPDHAPPFGPRHRPPPEMWEALYRRAQRSNEAVFELAGPRVLAAQSVQSASNRRYVLQVVLRRPHFGRPAADPRTQSLGVLVVLSLSGLVCYGLVRYLTAPMVSLRAATRQLAAGDLAARTGAAKRSRRDEVADLGRDFDAMAERIEALVVSQRRLLGDISHELRSPLSRMSMALALAHRHVAAGASESEIHGAFDRIKRETVRLNALIEQLLQLARLESGETQTDAVAVDLEHLLHDVVADADFEARETNRTVRVIQSTACQTTGSADLLRSAIENVVRNAVRYTASVTSVEVSLTCESGSTRASSDTHASGTVVIRVRDHGEGVPEETLGELFRPFYRVADARDRESGGVGLGLAITERAVRSHGGTVTAHNAPGGGLLVELRLPACPGSPQSSNK